MDGRGRGCGLCSSVNHAEHFINKTKITGDKIYCKKREEEAEVKKASAFIFISVFPKPSPGTKVPLYGIPGLVFFPEKIIGGFFSVFFSVG